MNAPDAVLLILRLGLAGVFGVAGGAKLIDQAGSRQGLREFGVPDRLVSVVAVLLPVAELAVAMALLAASTVVAGAAGALLLILLFIGAIGYSLARGHRPNCHCFGQLHSSRVSWRVLARNCVLATAAAAIVAAGWDSPVPSLVAWLGQLHAIQLAAVLGGAAALGLLTAQLILVIRIHGQTERLLRHLQSTVAATAGPAPEAGAAGSTQSSGTGSDVARPASVPALPVGARAPAFALPNADGRTVSLDALLAEGKPVLLVFSDDGCQPCRQLMPRLAELQHEHQSVVQIATLSNRNGGSRSLADESGLTPVLLQDDHEVSKAYGVPGTPTAILVNTDGTIATPPIAGDVEITRLVADVASRARAARPMPPPPATAHPDPSLADVVLPDLDGRPVSLGQFSRMPTVLLFWNPACKFCEPLLPRVREWEARPASARHQLLVVSAGNIDDNRALALSSTVVLDPEFSLGKRYGLAGTPAVAVLDDHGQLAGTPMTGGPAVLAALEFASGATPITSLLPRKRGGVEDELLDDGTMILYSSSRARVLTLNATAALVWECCDGEHRVSDIVREVREVFAGAPDAERDVRDLLTMLLQEGMVSLSDETGSAVEPQQASA